MMKVIPLLLSALALVLNPGAADAWEWPWSPKEDPDRILASGTVEVTEVLISFPVAGTLDQRLMDEGDAVRRGYPLASLDTREAVLSTIQAQASLSGASARLKELQAGYRREEIAQAEAAVAEARADLQYRRAEARRAEALFEADAISRQKLELEQTAADTAAQRYQSAREKLALLKAGYRPEQIAAAQAAMEEATAAALAARVRLSDREAVSPIDGVVLRTHAEPGENLAAGRPVLTVGDLASPWVRVYIPETHIGRIRLGSDAEVTVDSYPDRRFSGRVTYVASEAEFTPKNVQTQEERVKLVFAVDVRVENPEGILKPGMPADVVISSSADPVTVVN